METQQGIMMAFSVLEKYKVQENLPMAPKEGYVLTFQIMNIIQYLFIIIAAVIIISAILSFFNIRVKKIQEIFNYRDTTNGLTTLFAIIVLSIPGLVICIYRVVNVLKSITQVDYPPLVTKVIMPICSLKTPSFDIILNEIKSGALYFLIPIIFSAICMIIKRKDTASKTMLIMVCADIILLIICYRLFMIYYDLFAIRILF